MVRFGRTDDNQKDIVRRCRQIPGVSVQVTSDVGNGFPDIILGFRGINYLVEIKDGSKPPSAQALTKDQREWHDLWQGQKAVVNCFEDILMLLGLKGEDDVRSK